MTGSSYPTQAYNGLDPDFLCTYPFDVALSMPPGERAMRVTTKREGPTSFEGSPARLRQFRSWVRNVGNVEDGGTSADDGFSVLTANAKPE